jgi:hypothetical protein
MLTCSKYLPGNSFDHFEGVKINSSDTIRGVVSNYSKKMCGRVYVNAFKNIEEFSSKLSDILRELLKSFWFNIFLEHREWKVTL